MKAQHVTFRDAGLRSTPLRWLNRLGAAAARIGVGVPAPRMKSFRMGMLADFRTQRFGRGF